MMALSTPSTVGPAQRREEGSECSRLGERGVVAKECKASSLVGCEELAEE